MVKAKETDRVLVEFTKEEKFKYVSALSRASEKEPNPEWHEALYILREKLKNAKPQWRF